MTWSNPRVPYQSADKRKRLEPINGKPIMVNLCINVEYWPFDRPMPRGVLPPPHGVQIEPPNIPHYSWVEYGMRCGMPRFMHMLADRNLNASAEDSKNKSPFPLYGEVLAGGATRR